MQENHELLEKLEQIAEAHPQYKLEAYTFVLAALNHTIRALPKARHVSGQELSQGIRLFALEQYGPLARLVLEHFGIKNTRAFGEIVFIMIEAGLMSKTDKDTVEDFDEVYDFQSAFDRQHHIELDDLRMTFGNEERKKSHDAHN